MAISKYSKALTVGSKVLNPNSSPTKASMKKLAFSMENFNSNLLERGSELLKDDCTPEKYLFTHVTIVCSVDTKEVNAKKGSNVIEGFRKINRPYLNYRVLPECIKYINNNEDCWERDVLLKSYPTFIGADNFCFASETKILMADGTYKNIEDIKIGEEVITHLGNIKKVTHLFEREYQGDIKHINIDKYKTQIICTPNHPFLSLDVTSDGFQKKEFSKQKSADRYNKDETIKFLRGEKSNLKNGKINKNWKNAEHLEKGTILLGAELRVQEISNNKDLAYLLGYFLAEGSIVRDRNIIFSYGHTELDLAEETILRIKKCFPDAKCRIYKAPTSLRVEVNSKIAASWFYENGGKLSYLKKLNRNIFLWGKEDLLSIFSAWLTGDGNFNSHTSRLRGFSTSLKLVEQMKYIGDLCGVKTTISKINKKIGEIESHVIVSGKHYDVICRREAYVLTVSKEDVNKIIDFVTTRWKNVEVAIKKRNNFCWFENQRAFKVSNIETNTYQDKVYNIEVEDDHSYVVYPGVAVHNCEHVQLEEHSKGKVIDAVPRDIGPSVYVDLLVATSKAHKSLIKDILSNKLYTLSMGCSVLQTQCTKCGNVAEDTPDMCTHVLNEKGSSFMDEFGKKNRVAELCGHKTIDPYGGVNFIDASWVKVPAFTGAILRNILNPEDISEYEIRTANDLFANLDYYKSHSYKYNNISKMATLNALYSATLNKMAEEGDMEEEAPPPAEETDEKENLYDALQNQGYQLATQIIKNRILEELSKKWNDFTQVQKNDPAFSTKNNPTNLNNSLIKEAQYIENIYNIGVKNIKNISKDSYEFLKNVKNYNKSFNIDIPNYLYKTAFLAGSISNYRSKEEYIGSCSRLLSKNASFDESRILIKLGELLNNFNDF